MDLLVSIESTALGVWVRQSPSLLAFPTILALHTVGLGFLVGVSATIDLRILGFGSRKRPGSTASATASMEAYYPIMWVGFWVNAASGVVLTIAFATVRLTDPFFYLKLVFIALAVAVIYLIRNRLRDPSLDEISMLPTKFLALASLVCWTGAIVTGRLLAYFGG